MLEPLYYGAPSHRLNVASTYRSCRILARFILLPGFFALAAGASAPVQAELVNGFSGSFAPSAWTVVADEAGFADVSDAPASLRLQGPNDASGDEKTYTFSIQLPALNPAVGFRWAYESSDLFSSLDQFGYILNNAVFVNLSDPLGPLAQSGYIKVVADPSDIFAFAIRSVDSLGGPASVQISSFQAGQPAEIPDCLPCVPAPLPLLGAVAALRRASRLRRLSSRLRAA